MYRDVVFNCPEADFWFMTKKPSFRGKRDLRRQGRDIAPFIALANIMAADPGPTDELLQEVRNCIGPEELRYLDKELRRSCPHPSPTCPDCSERLRHLDVLLREMARVIRHNLCMLAEISAVFGCGELNESGGFILSDPVLCEYEITKVDIRGKVTYTRWNPSHASINSALNLALPGYAFALTAGNCFTQPTLTRSGAAKTVEN